MAFHVANESRRMCENILGLTQDPMKFRLCNRFALSLAVSMNLNTMEMVVE